MATVHTRSLIDWLVGVAKLDANTFEEIEHDESATIWAAVIAVLAGLSFGVGSALIGIAIGEASGWGTVVFFAIVYATFGLLSLTIFTTTAYLAGSVALKTDATEVTWFQLFRTLGFAGIPIVALGWMMVVHFLVLYIAAGWFLLAVVVAVRQALDFSTGRAIATALIAFAVALIPIVAIILAAPTV